MDFEMFIRQVLKNVVIVFILMSVFPHAFAADPVNSAIETRLKSQEATIVSQTRIDALSDETRVLLEAYRDALGQKENLQAYNDQLDEEIDFKIHRDKRQFLYHIRTFSGETFTNGMIRDRQFDRISHSPGTYAVEVQAIGRDLNYSAPARLTLTKPPPWYLNAWIAIPTVGGTGALVILSIFFGSKYYRQRREAQRLRDRLLEQEHRARVSLEEKNAQLEEKTIQLEESRRHLQEAKEAADSVSRTKSAFLATMSHELRTPLNAIIGYGELLHEELKDSGQNHHMQDVTKITQAGKHLLGLIDNILDLSKIEAGKMTFHLEDFEISTVVEQIVATVQPLVAKNGNTFEVDCPKDIGSMYADQTKVRQTLVNLLSNACKFTENGTIKLGLRREMKDGREWVLMRVEDTGIGMTPGQLGKLFRAFNQAESATSKKYGGTGLGLSISRRLCRLMGGELTATSEYGKGSMFTVQLPTVVSESRTTVDKSGFFGVRPTLRGKGEKD